MGVSHNSTIYRFLKPNILRIFSFQCFLCGFASAKNHVHHLDCNSSNHTPSNLAVLCEEHHRLVHKLNLSLDFELTPSARQQVNELAFLINKFF